MPRDYFGEEVAEHYDADCETEFAAEEIARTVDFLAAHAGDGPVLELGVGTGRIALPLSTRVGRVSGIDLSTAMVAKLLAKPGADAIDVTIGDFATTRVAGEFSLAYLVFNTIMNLTTQEEQVACFRNVASHLATGGRFVIEVSVPRLVRLTPGERYVPFSVTADHLGIDEYDVATQREVSHHYTRRNGQFHQVSIPFRYVWPAELDLMAQLAGMTLVERWGDWDRRPFTSESSKHVSVWQKAG